MARDNQVDRQMKANVAYEVDMRPTTILEENVMGGYTRTNKPVGVADPKPAEWESTGGRGTGDAIDARALGTNGRKW
jgi:hypothetical protein